MNPLITRSAFSLLEMVLALALGMLLLFALYLTLNTYVTSAQTGRETAAEGALARNLFNRIANDIAGQLGPIDPRGAAAPAGAAPAATDPVDPADPDAATSSTTTMTDTTTAAAQAPVTFNLGVKGDATSLTLSVQRVQKPRPAAPGEEDLGAPIASDLRSISFWLSQSGSETLGLCRTENMQATSDDIDADPTSLQDQEKFVFAPEVKSLTFEYFDGNTREWLPEWSGDTPGDATTGAPIGPPAAIRITVTFRRYARGTPGVDTEADGPTYQHIVPLPTSNSFTPKTASE